MEKFKVKPVGKISICEEGFFLEVSKEYVSALKGLNGFSHLSVLCWFHECDNEEGRSILQESSPYKRGPELMGMFATRSPARPNPIAFSAVQVISIDYEKGRIQIAYIDANDGTPLLDIKPYTPSIDRVERPGVPDWCSHWPQSCEESGNFKWEDEFNF